MEFVGQGKWLHVMISDGVWRWSLKILGYICGRLAMYVLLLSLGELYALHKGGNIIVYFVISHSVIFAIQFACV